MNDWEKRLKRGGWSIVINSKQQLEIFLNCCQKIGINWIFGKSISDSEFIYELKPPFIIRTAITKGYNETVLAWTSINGNTENCEDITEEFFNTKVYETIVPQNKYQEQALKTLFGLMNNSSLEEQQQLYEKVLELDNFGKLNIPLKLWELLNPVWKYAAMDENGEIWFYQHKPKLFEKNWRYDNVECLKLPNIFISLSTQNVIWNKSLVKRP